MANSKQGSNVRSLYDLLQRKIELARRMLDVTARELLLVDMDGLAPLLEHKDALIADIEAVDARIDPATLQAQAEGDAAVAALLDEYAGVVRSVLENERVFEQRMQEEQNRVREDMRAFEQQTRLKRYLDSGRPVGRGLNLKR